MEAIKHFIIGAVVMALIASVAFNFYQAGQLNRYVHEIPAMQKIEIK